jgi:SAM-dependent methyltransferase
MNNAQPSTPNLAAIKKRQQKAWSVGDYSKIGVIFVVIAEMLCEAMDLRPGRRILDVATGHGNAALAAVRRFCEVTGIDYVPEVLEAARKRAAAEGLVIDFQVGDAEEIPFPDASFDYVLSTLGAMFALDQEKTASCLGCASPEARSEWPTSRLTASVGSSANLRLSICLLRLPA